jgi:ppGpp synthetase/RelA/SpoT-type nucleotidyltranferase
MTIQGAAEAATYSEAVAGMEEFGIALKGLLREMLSHHGVDVHTIDHRVKEERSAKLKIDSSDGVYSGFSELHDLLGLRITCYFADEVNQIAGIIDREFDPDPTKSEDKGSKLGLQEFGYRSVHRVAGLGGNRTDLAEYARFKDRRFEVQIRTVLQHAWAEIEHDLGYKAETIPEPMRRRFSMLAGVLELVDYEFQSLRKELDTYEEKAEKAAKSPATDMALDIATLSSLIRSDETIMALDAAVADSVNRRLRIRPDGGRTTEHRLSQLRRLGITTISELRVAVEEWKGHMLVFVPKWTERRDRGEPTPGFFPRGIGLYYLFMVMSFEAMRQGRPSGITGRLRDMGGLEAWQETVAQVGTPPSLPG